MKAQGTLEEYGGGSMEKSIKFDVKVGVKELYFFLLHYNYASVNGAISLLLSLVSLGVFVFRLQYEWSTSNWFFLAIGLLFTVVQPVLLLKMAVTQKIKNPSMNDPLEYELREDGILLRQNDLEQLAPWDGIAKVVENKKQILVYTSRVNACIWPKKQLEEQKEELKLYVSEHVDAGLCKWKA